METMDSLFRRAIFHLVKVKRCFKKTNHLPFDLCYIYTYDLCYIYTHGYLFSIFVCSYLVYSSRLSVLVCVNI